MNCCIFAHTFKENNYDMSYKRLKKELIETFNLNSQQAFEKFFSVSVILLSGFLFFISKVMFSHLLLKLLHILFLNRYQNSKYLLKGRKTHQDYKITRT